MMISGIPSYNNQYFAYVAKSGPVNFKGEKWEMPESREVMRIADQVLLANLDIHLNNLVSPETEGRGVGSDGIDKAKKYIAKKFSDYGLEYVREMGMNDYFQTFTMPEYKVERKFRILEDYLIPLSKHKKVIPPGQEYIYSKLNKGDNVQTSNVLGIIRGWEKPDEYIVVSAHYDHIGKYEKDNIVYPGADDNASGVSAMLEIASIMSKERPRKSIIFAALSGEEKHSRGAEEMINGKFSDFGRNPKNVQVINLDMLGSNNDGVLEAWYKNGEKLEPVIDNLIKSARALNVRLKPVKAHGDIPGDAEKFEMHKISALTVIWGWDSYNLLNHPYYHSNLDDLENLDRDFLLKASKVVASAVNLSAN
jgi:acetylornithine deacetylase/succinyl-diaminopimelate desuccinylase-like protein